MSLFSEKCCCWHITCLLTSSRETHGASPRWSVCSWDVCVRYLAVWVSTRSLTKNSSFVPGTVLWVFCVILQVEVPQMDQLLSQLEEMSSTCSHRLSYTSAAKCFAGLINKRPPGQSAFLHSPPAVCSTSTNSSRDGLVVSSSGDSLDRLIQSTMKRVCSELDSVTSAVRTQAFTLMIWVRTACF